MTIQNEFSRDFLGFSGILWDSFGLLRRFSRITKNFEDCFIDLRSTVGLTGFLSPFQPRDFWDIIQLFWDSFRIFWDFLGDFRDYSTMSISEIQDFYNFKDFFKDFL